MKRYAVVMAVMLSTMFAFAGGSHSHGSAPRPVYSGSHHTESHGGTYSGGSGGSSHKGSHYTAPNGYKGYGTHKGN